MPHASKEAHNAYFREYNRQRWLRRKADLQALLGGACAHCGATDDLEFDHIDPATKSFSIAKYPMKAWDKLVAEAQKCQLLCGPCHKIKTYA